MYVYFLVLLSMALCAGFLRVLLICGSLCVLCVPPRHRVPVGAVGPGRRSPVSAVDPLAAEVVGEVDGEGAIKPLL